jgi:hypothetical protein
MRHTLLPEDLRENPRVDQIVTAARAGRVPVYLVSSKLSSDVHRVLKFQVWVQTCRRRIPLKNSLMMLLSSLYCKSSLAEHTEVGSSVGSQTNWILSVFFSVLIQSAPPSVDYLGIVSDRGLLSWFSSYAQETPSLQRFLSNSLHVLSLPSLNIYSSIIASTSTSTVLDAMRLMSEQGVSSVAVLEDETGTLLSAVSVTDIGKVSCRHYAGAALNSPCALDSCTITEQPDLVHAPSSVHILYKGMFCCPCSCR